MQGHTERTRTLAPYVALLALLPLLLVLPRIHRGLGAALRLFGETELTQVKARIRAARPETGLAETGSGRARRLAAAGS